MSNQLKADDLAEKYVAVRDLKAKVSAEYKAKEAKINEALDKLESEMLTFLSSTGQESANTKSGTFFKKMSASAKVADRDAFMHFVMENEAINFLTNHVSAEAVKEYIAEHDAVPPGLDYVQIVTVGVNRPRAR